MAPRAVRGRFVVIGGGYLVAGATSIALFLILEAALGINAVSVALAASGALVAALFAAALLRTGWRPHLTQLSSTAVVSEAGQLIAGSVIFLAANVGYVICVAVASRDGAGEATLYAYAYLAAAMLVGVTTASFAMVP